MDSQTLQRYYECERPEMLQFVPQDAKRILELGCANGRFSEKIKQRQPAEIWGIELNPDAASKAATRLDKVIQDDIYNALTQLPINYFECIVCNDILEHLPDPEKVLKILRKNITSDGTIVASIPNIRYLPVLFELLVIKDFRYRDSGVLDNTHLRFFTYKSIQRLFESSGYEVINMKGLEVPVPLRYSFIFQLVKIFSLGYYKDTGFIQFASVARKV